LENQFQLTIFDLPGEKKPSWEAGGNAAGAILILLRHRPDAVLDEFLAKIFTALDIQVATDARILYGVAADGVGFRELDPAHQFRAVISFGVPFDALGLRFRYQPWHPVHLGKRSFLYAEALEDIHRQRVQGGKEKSLLLWNALKQLFSKT